MILSISFFHSWLITFKRPSGLISSFDATLAPAAPVAPVALAVIYFSEDERSVVADCSPVLRPSA
jgi:hypothetical protein